MCCKYFFMKPNRVESVFKNINDITTCQVVGQKKMDLTIDLDFHISISLLLILIIYIIYRLLLWI